MGPRHSHPCPGYGEHVRDRENGTCFCHKIYGEEKDWGCFWYTKWLENVRVAVDDKKRLKAVFFPGQVGKGKFTMDRISAKDVDLWDNVGLGGSQKCELATVDMMGWSYDQVDVALVLQTEFERGCSVDAWCGEENRWRRGEVILQELVKVPRDHCKASDSRVQWQVRCEKTLSEFTAEKVCHTSMTMEAMSQHFGQDLSCYCICQVVASCQIEAK